MVQAQCKGYPVLSKTVLADLKKKELKFSPFCLLSHYSVDKQGDVGYQGTRVIRKSSYKNKVSATQSKPCCAAGMCKPLGGRGWIINSNLYAEDSKLSGWRQAERGIIRSLKHALLAVWTTSPALCLILLDVAMAFVTADHSLFLEILYLFSFWFHFLLGYLYFWDHS